MWPSSYDLDPNVVTGQLSTSALANILINYLNTSQAVIGLNPAGSYATMAAALAGKIDMAGGVAMTAALSMGSNRITNLATPTTGTDAATKAYVDAAAIGALTIHAPVRVASTANVVIATGGLIAVDGVTVASADRVLLWNQTAPAENGLYAAASGAWSRTSDANSVGAGQVALGLYVLVTQGATQAGQGFALTTTGTIVLGTTALTFNQYNQPGTGGAASGANVDITSMRALTGVLQAPTQVNDVNGNAVLQFASTASAVNNVSVKNTATGAGPQLSAVGTDSNIDLHLAPKGTGLAKLDASAQVTANGSTALLLKGSLTNVGVQPNTVTGLEAWYKADYITGFTGGSALTTWSDASSVGNNATAPSGTAPTYNTGRINGLPAVTFDGTDDFMTLGTALTDIRTVFWVVRETTSPGTRRPFLGSSAFSDFERAAAPGLAYWNTAAASANVLNGITRLNGTVVSAPTTTAFVQGSFEIVSIVTTGACHANQITQDQSYANSSWYGDIAEIIIYNVGLSDTDRANVEAYLANKYALPLTVSTGPNMLDIRDPGNNPVFVVTAAGGQQVKVNVLLTTGTYTATPSDYVIVVNKTTGSATAINLPAIPVTGQVYIIKDGKGDAATNNITITPSSGNIDGGANLVLSTNYGVARIVYNGAQWNAF